MIVSQLIEALQLCDPNAKVVTNAPNIPMAGVYINDTLIEAGQVANGLVYRLLFQNATSGLFVDHEPWRFSINGRELYGQSAVYIGNESSPCICSNKWTDVFPSGEQ